jgi:cell division protein FtsL
MILLLIVVICALGVVTSQHKARKLFQELENEQERAKQLDVEYGQLQLELSTWATPPRVEQIARDKLKMRLPDAAGKAVEQARLKPVAPKASAKKKVAR